MQKSKRSGKMNPRVAIFIIITVLIAALIMVFVNQEPADEWDTTTEATPTPYETDVFEPLDAERELFMHVGNSMRPAAEAIAAEYQERHGIGVRFNFGGSSELLSSIELGQIGDLYMPHDPYAEMLDEKGLLDYYEVVGYLAPIIVVPKGNPMGIEGMEDLATRDLKVSIPDRRYATAGQLVEEAFQETGLLEELENNIVMEGRSHNDVAMGLFSGEVDAGMVWNFIATFHEDRLDMLDPGVDFPEVRVTLCMLSEVRDREAAEKFMELATSEFGQNVFEEYGYIIHD